MREPSAIETLSALLQSSHAQPRVRPERLVPSAIYDLDYRVFVIAAAFELHAKGELLTGRRIHATKLKLLQFVAIRPRLLPVIRSWSAIGGDGTSFAAHELRRGFLGDQMYDSVVALLVARGALEWMGAHLGAGSNAGLLAKIYTAAVGGSLFIAERRTLEELAHVRVTVRMLGGM